jgi:hypothetical protein
MASLDELNEILSKSGELLDRAAEQIRDLRLDSEANIRKIAQILMTIFEIRLQISEQRPDLKPDYLKK